MQKSIHNPVHDEPDELFIHAKIQNGAGDTIATGQAELFADRSRGKFKIDTETDKYTVADNARFLVIEGCCTHHILKEVALDHSSQPHDFHFSIEKKED